MQNPFRPTIFLAMSLAGILPGGLFAGHQSTAGATSQSSTHGEHEHAAATTPVKCEILVSQAPVAGKQATAIVRLTGPDSKPLTFDQLQIAHTQKLHLLVVDETLTDYHHEHPAATTRPGEYRFDFSPRVGGTYYIWADVIPIATGKQQYARSEVHVEGPPATKNKALNNTAEASGYSFTLKTENEEPLQVGRATMVNIRVMTPDGKDFTGLEPVMGAFAHMVAFPESLEAVTHIHPMGAEPKEATERGGPELSFHVEPDKPGFQKFFLQTEIGGRQVYAAFGMEVAAATAAAPSSTNQYTCPMHSEVVTDKPGKCPKCGMALVVKK